MKTDKMGKRQIQAIETKNKIYETARQLFKEHGFENVSVDSIVEAAGVSKGSFYVHFESKDAMAAALVNDYVNEVDLDYKSYLEAFDAETPVLDILILFVEKIANVIAFTIGFKNMRALYKAHLTKTVKTDTAVSYDRYLYKMFSKILETGVRRGELREDIPVEALANRCIMAIRGITYEWCIRYPDFDLKEQCLEHFEILLKGIKKP